MHHDYTNRLGFVKMPPGYTLLLLDESHFVWYCEETDEESCINWDRWCVYHGAWAHYKERTK
jgi:hypothetical protein